MHTGPILYGELAPWWPLMSAPADYAEEAEAYWRVICRYCSEPPRALLELGSGGGNNASHLKRHAELTLVDRSEPMLAVSRALNPECEHHAGDMRSVRLGRQWDAVFVHDAVSYMTTPSDLRAAVRTAFLHCAPGGVALFVPDFVRETFEPGSETGGHDGEREGREGLVPGLRYLSWHWDPDPSDHTFLVHYAYMLRDERGGVEVHHERHVEGLFSVKEWLGALSAEGFDAHEERVRLSDVERDLVTFVGRRPATPSVKLESSP